MSIFPYHLSDWRANANFRTGRDVAPDVARWNDRIEALLRRLESRPFTRVVANRALALWCQIR